MADVRTSVDECGAEAARTFGAAQALANALPGRNNDGNRVKWGKDTKLKNKVQLTAYPDCIGKDLSDLEAFVSKHCGDVVHGMHVLPFYPSSADRGFAPITYQEVDESFGTWEDIKRMSAERDFCVDFMVNHCSAQSEEFKDFAEKKDKSEWAKLFINWKEFWGGEPSDEDVERIYSRKPEAPKREVEHPDGSTTEVWNTFSKEQIDMDVFNEKGREYIERELTSLMDRGANLIRLDAFGYTTKKAGTNCFFVEPDISDLLDTVRDILGCRDTELLCEVHEHYMMQKKLADKGLWVYDFALPMLCIQAMYDGDANNIKAWLLKCPRNQITTLDTHDGIGVVDVADLMTEAQVDRTKENIFEHGANVKKRYNTSCYGAMDTYQVNSTYYSALADNDLWYLLARAIQFFTPGIPLVYYVGLLAGRNDTELTEETKNGRNINRHFYGVEEAEKELERPVVKLLFEMCRFRNRHPAFDGTFELLDTLTDVRSSVTMSDRALPSDGPGMETLKNVQDEAARRGSTNVQDDDDFLKHMCGSNFSVTESKVDWSVGRVLKDEELAHENSSSESDSDGAGARVRKGADEKYKRFSAYSPAMNNMSDEDRRKLMRTPTCKEGESMDADERASACRAAAKRDKHTDLPREVICMKWKNDEHWCVLEGNVATKAFRIIYSDPRDGQSKVWNVSCTYHSMANTDCEKCAESS